jgi:hypothetical protein
VAAQIADRDDLVHPASAPETAISSKEGLSTLRKKAILNLYGVLPHIRLGPS